MSTLEGHNEGNERSSKNKGNALCDSFNKLQVRKASKTCFYEDYLLARTKLFLLQNDEVDPAIPSKFGDIIQKLKKFLQDVPLHIKRSKQCVEDFYRMLLFLQDYLNRYIEVFKQYPLSRDLLSLLIEYVELEYEVLYLAECYSGEYQKQVENRILTYLLLFLYDPNEKKGTNRKNLVDSSAINALYVIKNVKSDYKREHDLIENLMSKLLLKLNILDTMNEIRKGNVDTVNAEKLLQVPRLQEISRQLQNCSYVNDLLESDDEIQEIDIPRPMQVKAEQIEIKVDTSQYPCFNVEENLNHESDNKKFNVDSNNSNKCKCGHYNCSISCNARTILYISDDDCSSDIEITEHDPVSIIDLDADETLSGTSASISNAVNKVESDELLTKNATENDSDGTKSTEIGSITNTTMESVSNKTAIQNSSTEEKAEEIEEKVDLTRYTNLNDKKHISEDGKEKCSDKGISILISDDEDDSDIEITGTTVIPTIELESDDKLKDVITEGEGDILMKNKSVAANNSNTNGATMQSPLNQDQKEIPTDKCLEENVTKLGAVNEKLNNDDNEDSTLNTTVQPTLDESSVVTTENRTDIVENESSAKSSDNLESNDLLEDVHLHEDICDTVNVNVQQLKNHDLVDDEERNDVLTKNIIDQLESAIQDTEITSQIFQQNNILQPQTEINLNEISLEEMRYESDIPILTEEIVNQPVETEEVIAYTEDFDQEEIVIEEPHDGTMIIREEEITILQPTLNANLEDDETRENSSINDSCAFDISPLTDSEEVLIPTYNYEVASDTQLQDNEDCVIRSSKEDSEQICDSQLEVQVDPVEDCIDEHVVQVQIGDTNSTPISDQSIESDYLTSIEVEVTTNPNVCDEPKVGETNENNIQELIPQESVDEKEQITPTEISVGESTRVEEIFESTKVSEALADSNSKESSEILPTNGTQVSSTETYTQEAPTESTTEVFPTKLDFFANAALGHFTNADNLKQSDSGLVTENQLNAVENLQEKNTSDFETKNDFFENQTESVAIEPKLEHIVDDYVHEETVIIEPCESFAEVSLNDLNLLAAAAAERKQIKSVRVKGVKKNKRGRKKIIKKETKEDSTPRRVTRSTTVSKLTIPNTDVQDNSKCIPSTFMNLENLVTPPPVCVYNLIPSTISEDESIDEPFSYVQNLQEILVRNVAYDEDTLDDKITLVAHEKEVDGEVIISIPETEKDYPGINYDILNQAEEFVANTNLSLSTSEELCKELKLTMTKNKEVNSTETHQIIASDLDNELTEGAQLETKKTILVGNHSKQRSKKKKTLDKITHAVPIKKRRNHAKNNISLPNAEDKTESTDSDRIIEKPVSVKLTEEKQNLIKVVDTEMKLPKSLNISERPFPTKAALKCFQISCNPYVQLQKLPITCENTIIIENIDRQRKNVDKSKNREKRESRSLSESKPKVLEPKFKRRKSRRSTVDCVLDEDNVINKIQKTEDKKITRRRMSSKFSYEILMGIENGLDIDEILEKEELTINPKTRSHHEKTQENSEVKSIVRTRSKSNRNKKYNTFKEVNNETKKILADISQVPQNILTNAVTSENVESQDSLKPDLKNELSDNNSNEIGTIEDSLEILETHEYLKKKKRKKREISTRTHKVKTKSSLIITRSAIEDKSDIEDIQENVETANLEFQSEDKSNDVLEDSAKELDLTPNNEPFADENKLKDKNRNTENCELLNVQSENIFDTTISSDVIKPCLQINVITEKYESDSAQSDAVQEICIVAEDINECEFEKDDVKNLNQNQASQEIDIKTLDNNVSSNDTLLESTKSTKEDEINVEQEYSVEKEEELCLNDQSSSVKEDTLDTIKEKETEINVQQSELKRLPTEDTEERIEKVSVAGEPKLDPLEKEKESKSSDDKKNSLSTKTDESIEIPQPRNNHNISKNIFNKKSRSISNDSNKLYFKSRLKKYKELNKKFIKTGSRQPKIAKTEEKQYKSNDEKEQKTHVDKDQKRTDKHKQLNTKSKRKAYTERNKAKNEIVCSKKVELENVAAVQSATLDVNENSFFHKEDVSLIPLPAEKQEVLEKIEFESDSSNKETNLLIEGNPDITNTTPLIDQESVRIEETIHNEDITNKNQIPPISNINEISSSGEALDTSSHEAAIDHNLDRTEKEKNSLWTIDKIISTNSAENKIELKERLEDLYTPLEKTNEVGEHEKEEVNEDKITVEHDELVTRIELITPIDTKPNDEENKFNSHIKNVTLEEGALDLSNTCEKDVLNHGFPEENIVEPENTERRSIDEELATSCEIADVRNEKIEEAIPEINESSDVSNTEDLVHACSTDNDLQENNDVVEDQSTSNIQRESSENNLIEILSTLKEDKYMVNAADIVIGHEESIVTTEASEDTLSISNLSSDKIKPNCINIFSKNKLNRRNSISTDTHVFRERNIFKPTKIDILEKYDVECTPYKKSHKIVKSDSNNVAEINKKTSAELQVTDSIKTSDQEVGEMDMEKNYEEPMIHTQETNEKNKTEVDNVKGGGQCSDDDEVVLISVRKLPEDKTQSQDDDYAYDSEPIIDKLFEKYAKKKNNHSETEASYDSITSRQKKIPNEKRVRFNMERNTVKRIFAFEEEESKDSPSTSKKMKMEDRPRNKEKNYSQRKSNRDRKEDALQVDENKHIKSSENKSKDRKKEDRVNKKRVSQKGEKSNRDGDIKHVKTESRKQDRNDSSTKRNIDNQLFKKSHESSSKREKSTKEIFEVSKGGDSRKREKKRDYDESTSKIDLELPKKIKHVEENISSKEDKTTRDNMKSLDQKATIQDKSQSKCKKSPKGKVCSKTKQSGSVDNLNQVTDESKNLSKQRHHKEIAKTCEIEPNKQKDKIVEGPETQKENLGSGFSEVKCFTNPIENNWNKENCKTSIKTSAEDIEEIKVNENIPDTSTNNLQATVNKEEKQQNGNEDCEPRENKSTEEITEVNEEQSKIQVTSIYSSEDNTEGQCNADNGNENDQSSLQKEPEISVKAPLEVALKCDDEEHGYMNVEINNKQENSENYRKSEKLNQCHNIYLSTKLISAKKKESKRIDIIIENLKNKTSQKDNGENFIALMIDDKIDHEEHVESTIKPDNFLVETVTVQSEPLNSETVQNDLDKNDVESFFPEFDLDQSKLQAMNTEPSQCEDIFPYIEGSKKDDCLLEIDPNENAIEITSSLADNSVSLLDVSDKQEDGAEASTSCEITDNLIAVMFSEQNRSNKTGFIFFKGSDHNYHSMGDPLLGGECDTNESDHSSDHKEIPSPELENVLVNDTILPYISTLTENHLNQESSEDSGADFQLLELIGNTLARESSPPLTQTINCDNLYQQNLKHVELEYDENTTINGVEFSKINSEVFINQFQQQTMSVENMSELMNVVLTSIQNLNNMTKPIPILQQDSNCKEGLFLPSDLDLNDVIQQSQPQTLDLICDFSQAQATDLSSECSSSNTPIPETDYSNVHFTPVSYENAPIVEESSTKRVIVEHIPQYIEEPVKEVPPPEIIIEKPSTPIKVTTSRPTLSETIAMAKQNIALSTSPPKKPLNNLGFVRNSSKTKPSAPKPKKICDSKKDPKGEVTREVEATIKLKSIESLINTPVPKNFTSSPPKERSLPIIDDLTPTIKKVDVKINKIREDENCARVKQSPAYTKSPRTPRQVEQKIESNECAEVFIQSDMIDNVKRRKRKPVDYSSIEKLLENDEFDYTKMQKMKTKKDDKTKGKQKEEEAKIKKVMVADDAIPSTSSVNDDQAVSIKTKTSIFEDSDDDVPKKKRSKPEPRLEAEAMNALFDRLVKEGDINKVTKSSIAEVSQDPPRSTTSSIFSVDPGLQKKSETTPVKQIGVVNPIPRQSNHMRKELLPNRGSYVAGEDSRTSSQYYPYYPERTRRSYPYSSRETRDSRPSNHQGSGRRTEYSTHSNDQRYSSQRSSSSSRSSRSSRHHSNSRSNTEQRGYWFGSGSDLSWREDMKKKFPNVFKDDFF